MVGKARGSVVGIVPISFHQVAKSYPFSIATQLRQGSHLVNLVERRTIPIAGPGIGVLILAHNYGPHRATLRIRRMRGLKAR